jgi:hypothetical protein
VITSPPLVRTVRIKFRDRIIKTDFSSVQPASSPFDWILLGKL